MTRHSITTSTHWTMDYHGFVTEDGEEFSPEIDPVIVGKIDADDARIYFAHDRSAEDRMTEEVWAVQGSGVVVYHDGPYGFDVEADASYLEIMESRIDDPEAVVENFRAEVEA